jgi:hypothetical protein
MNWTQALVLGTSTPVSRSTFCLSGPRVCSQSAFESSRFRLFPTLAALYRRWKVIGRASASAASERRAAALNAQASAKSR